MSKAAILLKKYTSMKTLPHVAIQLSKLISDPKTSMQEFEKVIKMDPILVMRLLRLVNSPYYGLRQKVDSIPRAIVFIGMKNLRNMVVVAALQQVFKDNPQQKQFSRAQLWLHSATAGICCQMIAERIMGKKGEDAFLCGILHDIGLIVEEQVDSQPFLQACQIYTHGGSKSFIEVEEEQLGTNHCQIGFLLSKEWSVPTEVQEGIRHHHNLTKKLDPQSIAGIVQCADFIVTKLKHRALPNMKPVLSPHMISFFRQNLNEFGALIKDIPAEIEKAKELYTPQEE